MNAVQHTRAVIELENLQRQLGGQTVLNAINARVYPGDVVGLIGRNGAGKTTLLDTLLGFGLASFGECHLWGERCSHLSNTAKQRIGYVPQRDELPGDMTAEKLMHLYRQLRPQWNQPLVDRLMDEWALVRNRRIKRLSEGQKQKLAIVLALAHDPELLILDEPVAALDPLARRQFLQQLMDYAASSDRAIVFSSHIVSDMERIANRVWCLKGGTLCIDCPLDALYESVARIIYTGSLDERALVGERWIIQHRPQSAELIVDEWGQDKHRRLGELGAQSIEASPLGLEDIFLHWLGDRHD